MLKIPKPAPSTRSSAGCRRGRSAHGCIGQSLSCRWFALRRCQAVLIRIAHGYLRRSPRAPRAADGGPRPSGRGTAAKALPPPPPAPRALWRGCARRLVYRALLKPLIQKRCANLRSCRRPASSNSPSRLRLQTIWCEKRWAGNDSRG